jgi:hypothetical protein
MYIHEVGGVGSQTGLKRDAHAQCVAAAGVRWSTQNVDAAAWANIARELGSQRVPCNPAGNRGAWKWNLGDWGIT